MRTREDLEALGLTEDEILTELESQEEMNAQANGGGGDDESKGKGAIDPAAANANANAEAEAEAAAAAARQADADAAAAAAAAAGNATGTTTETAGADGKGKGGAAVTPGDEDPLAALNERGTEIDAELTRFAQQFDDAELTAAEYRAAIKPLEEERRKLEREQVKLEAKAEYAQEEAVRTWGNNIRAFLKGHAEYKPGSLLYQALDTAVQRVQTETREAGGDPTSPEVLTKAHALVQSELGLSKGGKTENTETPEVKDPAAAGGAKVEKKTINVPPTLARIPAGATSDADTSEWAWLDRLRDNPNPDDPEAYERELRKLGTEKRNAYMAAG